MLWARGGRWAKVWEINKITYGPYLENLLIIDLKLDS
jgi:hypothetical protein